MRAGQLSEPSFAFLLDAPAVLAIVLLVDDRLGEIEAPTLIVQGRHDRARTVEHGAAMRDRIPGAWLEVLEGSGHTPQLEEPEAFHAVALPFLLARV